MASTLPRNQDVAEQFELLADLLELEGSDAFRVIAYRRAAQRMRETAGSIAQLALEGKAKELSGIGKTIEEKIVQIVSTGRIDALAQREERIPPDVRLFMRLPGLGPKTAAKIWLQLGVTTIEGLRQAAEQERLRTLPGLGAKTEENVLRALAAQVEAPAEERALLGQGLPAVRAVVEALRGHPAADLVSEAGSVRRRRETFRDLDVIATSPDPEALIAAFVGLELVSEVAARGGTKATVVSHDGLRFDLRVVPPESYGNLLQHFTGSKDHNVALREDGVRRGLSISEYGVTTLETGEVFSTRDEAAVYEFLGYAFVPPELRENAGELEAARTGALPELIELSDLRGDLHLHSTWSADGRGTVEEMAEAAKARGYAYLCITDHSHYLRDGRLEAQAEEIAAVGERLGRFHLLRGVEVNIRADGSLDMADEDLAACDWVVASLHSAFDRSPTERIMAAMENPNVDLIGHPTARKLNRRAGADIDIERAIAKAVETGTALEINSQADRLDLRDAHARNAGEAGARIVISSDAHSVGALGNVELGVAQARRAWLGADQVLNTKPWRDVKPRR
ncbi:MAG: DNA polymerase/3'-5' exonuclease PolX [Thermoleophilia bacterium]|nr:DNA polymerase/3'-5' exonuclease PolX [Thermoleophilia bacterium]